LLFRCFVRWYQPFGLPGSSLSPAMAWCRDHMADAFPGALSPWLLFENVGTVYGTFTPTVELTIR
jgi:hypothetical protein